MGRYQVATPVNHFKLSSFGRLEGEAAARTEAGPIRAKQSGDQLRELSDDLIKNGSDKIKSCGWIRIHPLHTYIQAKGPAPKWKIFLLHFLLKTKSRTRISDEPFSGSPSLTPPRAE